MPTLIIALSLIVVVLLVLMYVRHQQLRIRAQQRYRKEHPSLGEQQKALTRAFSMDETMSTADYEKQLDQLLRSKSRE